MKARNVRVSGRHIEAQLGSRLVQLIDLSVSGAQLEVDEVLQIGSEITLVLSHASVDVALRASVVRTEPSRRWSSRWLVGIQFLNVSAAGRKAIVRLLSGPTRS